MGKWSTSNKPTCQKSRFAKTFWQVDFWRLIISPSFDKVPQKFKLNSDSFSGSQCLLAIDEPNFDQSVKNFEATANPGKAWDRAVDRLGREGLADESNVHPRVMEKLSTYQNVNLLKKYITVCLIRSQSCKTLL